MSSKYPKKLEEMCCRCSSGVLMPECGGGGTVLSHSIHHIDVQVGHWGGFFGASI